MDTNYIKGLRFNFKDREIIGRVSDILVRGYEDTLTRPADYKKKVTFAPSGLGYGHTKCPRYWHIAFDGTIFESEKEISSLVTMQNGSDSHARMQKAYATQPECEALEVEIKLDDPPVRGYLDVLLNLDGKVVPVECKTTRQEIFWHKEIKKEGSITHILQLMMYMHALREQGRDCDTGLLHYENRNDNTPLYIAVHYDEHKDQLDTAFKWMREVYQYHELNKVAPKAPWTKRNAACRGCPVFEECWINRDPGTVKLLPLEVK